MKKNILMTLVLGSLFLSACSMDRANPNSGAYIRKASVNTNSIMNANYKDIQGKFGTPYTSVYYIDSDKLKGKNLNNLKDADLKDAIIAQTAYEVDKNQDSYLHVYYEGGLVKDAVTGHYSLFNSDKFKNDEFLSKANYKVEFFNTKGLLCKKEFALESAKSNLIGGTINDFNNAHHVKTANFIAHNLNGTEKLYFYPLIPANVYHSKDFKHPHYAPKNITNDSIVNPVNNNISNLSQTDNYNLADYANTAVLVYTKDNKITNFKIVDNKFVYKLLEETFTE